jgi:hypothetical protein
MKTHLFPALLLFTVVLAVGSSPLAWADGLQKDTPGAQGTASTDPTHQDSNVTGPNGEHSTNTNPATTPAAAQKTCNGSGCSN